MRGGLRVAILTVASFTSSKSDQYRGLRVVRVAKQNTAAGLFFSRNLRRTKAIRRTWVLRVLLRGHRTNSLRDILQCYLSYLA